MGQPHSAGRQTQIEIERKLLAALCHPALDAQTRAAILGRLKQHVFAEPDHQVICRALATMPPVEPAEMRQALIQAVTRLGFPDIELGWLFTKAPTREEIAGLLENL